MIAKRILYLSLDGTVRKGLPDLGHLVTKPEHVEILPGVIDLMIHYKQSGWFIAGFSNAGDIALGNTTEEDIKRADNMTMRLCHNMFDAISHCRHHPESPDPLERYCYCRVPKYGQLIALQFMIFNQYPGTTYPPTLSLVVGNQGEDRTLALNAGVPYKFNQEWKAESKSHASYTPEVN